MKKASVTVQDGSRIEITSPDREGDFCITIGNACEDVLCAYLTEAEMIDLHIVIGRMIYRTEE